MCCPGRPTTSAAASRRRAASAGSAPSRRLWRQDGSRPCAGEPLEGPLFHERREELLDRPCRRFGSGTPVVDPPRPSRYCPPRLGLGARGLRLPWPRRARPSARPAASTEPVSTAGVIGGFGPFSLRAAQFGRGAGASLSRPPCARDPRVFALICRQNLECAGLCGRRRPGGRRVGRGRVQRQQQADAIADECARQDDGNGYVDGHAPGSWQVGRSGLSRSSVTWSSVHEARRCASNPELCAHPWGKRASDISA